MPGVVVASGPRSIVFGEWAGGEPTPRVRAILDAAAAGGVAAAPRPGHPGREVGEVRAARRAVGGVGHDAAPARRHPPSPAAVALLARPDDRGVDRRSRSRRAARRRASSIGSSPSSWRRPTSRRRRSDRSRQRAIGWSSTRCRAPRCASAVSSACPTPNMTAAYAILEPWAIRNARPRVGRLTGRRRASIDGLRCAMTDTAVETPTFRHFIAGEWVRLRPPARPSRAATRPTRATSSGGSSRGRRRTSRWRSGPPRRPFRCGGATPAPKRGEILYRVRGADGGAQGAARRGR